MGFRLVSWPSVINVIIAKNNSNCRVSIDLNQNCLHIGAILKDLMETSVFNLWHYNDQNQSRKFYNFVLLRNTFHSPPIIPLFPPTLWQKGSLKIKFLELFFFPKKTFGTKFKNWRTVHFSVYTLCQYYLIEVCFKVSWIFLLFEKYLKTCKKFQKFLLKRKLFCLFFKFCSA